MKLAIDQIQEWFRDSHLGSFLGPSIVGLLLYAFGYAMWVVLPEWLVWVLIGAGVMCFVITGVELSQNRKPLGFVATISNGIIFCVICLVYATLLICAVVFPIGIFQIIREMGLFQMLR